MENLTNTGITRSIDDLGRVVLPIEIRKELDITTGDEVAIFIDKANRVVALAPSKPKCVFCEETEELVDFKNRNVCKYCVMAIN